MHLHAVRSNTCTKFYRPSLISAILVSSMQNKVVLAKFSPSNFLTQDATLSKPHKLTWDNNPLISQSMSLEWQL